MSHYPETPDSWIERLPEEGAPDPADCCPVCGTYNDCVCLDDADEKTKQPDVSDVQAALDRQAEYNRKWHKLTRKTADENFPSILQSEEDKRRQQRKI